ncbi:hypothetical protein IAT38_002057 [Cryptococcus sp. DSM 104549]
MARITLFLFTLLAFALVICAAAAAPTPTEDHAELASRLDRMSNAQRMKRGLPLRKPSHFFDARLGPRAPAPSRR